ncbi:MAG: nucleotidyltransferase domain-containing protein [Planctomycetota bacterium]|nr:nucleotidyltransferase domain-containing protein [Planctomycetota bacterium]
MNVLSPLELDRKLAEAKRRLQAMFGPCEIYLFGSYATGTPRAESDIDLAVVLPSSNLDFHTRCVEARKALMGFGHPLDVLVYTVAEFEERAGWFASLERTVKETGRLLHAA